MPTKPKPRQAPRFDPQRTSSPEMIDLIDPTWVLKALGGSLLFALLCAYVTLCVLYSHGQWQLVLNPTRTVATTPASIGMPFTEVHFGVDSTGQPQLDGWFIPAASSAAEGGATSDTALLLHSGDGSMSDALPAARLLHDQRLNVLLFDYRGYGHSLGQHPTEASMQADADTALVYLTTTRSTPIASIVVYGEGAGASLAVQLCANYPAIPALILQAPDGDFGPRVRRDPRSKIVPVSLLFDQDFALKKPLQALSTPRLELPTTTANLAGFLSAHLPPPPTPNP